MKCWFDHWTQNYRIDENEVDLMTFKVFDWKWDVDLIIELKAIELSKKKKKVEIINQ